MKTNKLDFKWLIRILYLMIVFVLSSCTDDNSKVKLIVTFDKNLGIVDTSAETMMVTYGTMAPNPIIQPEREGYIFKGWYLSPNTKDTAGIITKETTLYAKWSYVVFIVRFDKNGGDFDAIPSTTQVGLSMNALLPLVAPVKLNKNFSGWYKQPECIDTAGLIMSDITLYAKWIEPTFYKVTFDRNGGDTDPIPFTVDAMSGFYAPSPTTLPTKAGYHFIGWFKQVAAKDTAGIITDETTLYAKWQLLPPAGYQFITSPTGLTYLDRNLGATSNDITKTTSYGNYISFAQAVSVCPPGFRLPTLEEVTNDLVWLHTILPKAGFYYNGTLLASTVGTRYFMWVADASGSVSTGLLYFVGSTAGILQSPYNLAYTNGTVRCVVK